MRYGIFDGKDYTELKKLWKTAFHDEDAYIEYYFRTVAAGNLIFAAWEDGHVVSMVHLNPYTLICSGKTFRCHYIVGVATEPEYRRRGIMKRLLAAALAELKERNEGFTYLMPAKEIYYQSMGFQRLEPGYIFAWEDYLARYGDELSSAMEENGPQYEKWQICNLHMIGSEQWEDYNRRLSKVYDLFARRDAAYMADLQEACRSLSGDVYIVTEGGRILATMGIMYEDGRPECVQYLSTDLSLRPMQYVGKQLGKMHFSDIEIFGSWFPKKYPLLCRRPGKGIMYKLLKEDFSKYVQCDKMLMINEIV